MSSRLNYDLPQHRPSGNILILVDAETFCLLSISLFHCLSVSSKYLRKKKFIILGDKRKVAQGQIIKVNGIPTTLKADSVSVLGSVVLHVFLRAVCKGVMAVLVLFDQVTFSSQQYMLLYRTL